jgi:prophage maintenance system killer protein
LALAAAEVFLLLNAHTLDATDQELEALTLGVAAGNHFKDEVTDFLRSMPSRALNPVEGAGDIPDGLEPEPA